jgi:transcriptional regulator with XRE-family HTH domain
MPVSNGLEIAVLVRETRHRLGLTQLQFAQKLSVSFQSVNRWENRHTQPLPIVLKQIEETLRKMGECGTDLRNSIFWMRRKDSTNESH